MIGLSIISLVLASFIALPYSNRVTAQQQQNSTNPSGNNNSTGNSKTISITPTPNKQQQQNPYSMSMGSHLQNQNWTGSTSLFSQILNAFKSKIHTTLNDATTNAINAIGRAGSNSSVLAAFIHPQNGFLVYDVLLLDSSNNIRRVIVDSGNGKVISIHTQSMMDMISMTYPFMGMRMEGHSPHFQLNLSGNHLVIDNHLSICGLICHS